MAEMATAEMLIGELADAVGVNPKTIRYYEQVGLLPDPRRTESGYRLYDERDAARLRFVRRAQQLDLRLDEIAEILALRDRGEVPCSYVRDVAAQRLAELDARIAEMRAARNDLAALLDTADEAASGGHDADFCALIEHHNEAMDHPA